jgi:hypothetical protein
MEPNNSEISEKEITRMLILVILIPHQFKSELKLELDHESVRELREYLLSDELYKQINAVSLIYDDSPSFRSNMKTTLTNFEQQLDAYSNINDPDNIVSKSINRYHDIVNMFDLPFGLNVAEMIDLNKASFVVKNFTYCTLLFSHKIEFISALKLISQYISQIVEYPISQIVTGYDSQLVSNVFDPKIHEIVSKLHTDKLTQEGSQRIFIQPHHHKDCETESKIVDLATIKSLIETNSLIKLCHQASFSEKSEHAVIYRPPHCELQITSATIVPTLNTNHEYQHNHEITLDMKELSHYGHQPFDPIKDELSTSSRQMPVEIGPKCTFTIIVNCHDMKPSTNNFHPNQYPLLRIDEQLIFNTLPFKIIEPFVTPFDVLNEN